MADSDTSTLSEQPELNIDHAAVNVRQIVRLFQPYYGRLLLLSFVAFVMSFLTVMTTVAITPLASIVLSGVDATTDLPPLSDLPSFNLEEIPSYLLSVWANFTGLTDPWDLLLLTSLVYLVLALFVQAANFLSHYGAEVLRHVMIRDMEHEVFSHIMHLPLSFLNKYPAGWLHSRIREDLNAAMTHLTKLIIDGFSSSLVSIIYVVLLIRTDFRLTVIAGLAGLAHMTISRVMTKAAVSRTTANFDMTAQLGAFTQERLANIREIKTRVGEDFEKARFWERVKEQVRIAARYFIYLRVKLPIRWSVNRVVMVAVMLFAAFELLNGRLDTATFALFLFVGQSLVDPLAKLADIILQTRELRSMLTGVAFLLDQQTEPSGTQAISIGDFQQAIEVDGISFAYEDAPVLENITLSIKKGA
ncbi:MAG: ABC transporter ATP-binding protein, partial [Chloroflexi bacterium]|nr:ABC transporter ATP-binding protein [Chloroflexota bacterium]